MAGDRARRRAGPRSTEPVPGQGKSASAVLPTDPWFETMFASAPSAVAFLDRDLRYLRVNDRLAQMHGVAAAEHLGRTIFDVVPDVAVRAAPVFRKVMDTGEALLGLEFSGETAAHPGAERWWLEDVYPVRDHAGAVCGVAVRVEDVTAHRQAEDEARLAARWDGERLYNRGLIEASVDGLVTVDVDGTISDVNSRMCQLAGLPRSEIIGTTFADYFTDPAGARAGVRRTLREGVVTDDALTLVSRSGYCTPVSWNASVFRDAAGEVKGVFASSREITDQVRAAYQLTRLTDLLNRTQEISKTGGWDYEIETRRLYWTDEVYRIYGLDRTDDPPEVAAAIVAFDADSKAVLEAAFQRLVAEGEAYDLELGLIQGDGQRIWVRTIGRPQIEDGRIVRVGGNIVDITARKQAEEALRESEDRYRSLSEASFEGIAIHDQGTIINANNTFAAMFGYTVEEVIGMRALDLAAPKFRPVLADHLRDLRDEAYEGFGRRKDGSTFEGELRGKWTQYDGRAARVVSIRDITARTRAESALRRSEERFRTLLETSPAPLVVSRAGTVVYANPAFSALLDAPDAATLIGQHALTFVAADFRAPVAHQLESVESGDRPTPSEQHWTSLAGRDLWVAVSNVPITYEGGPAVLKFAFDVTGRRDAENALREARDLFESAFAGAPIGVALVSLDPATPGQFLQVNGPLCEMLGYAADDLVGRSVLDVTHPDEAAAIATALARIADSTDSTDSTVARFTSDRRCVHADGHVIWVRVHTSPVRNASGRPSYTITHIEDVTEAKQVQERLAHQAMHDPLTGLANRHLLIARLQHSLDELGRTDAAVGVLYVDLDGFKTVNDSVGHGAGDRFLAEVGRRLASVVRRHDTAARIGGDEFVIVAGQLAADHDVARVIERVQVALEPPIVIDGDTFAASASIGVVVTRAVDDDPSQLLRAADTAMYRAKQAGRGRHEIFNDALRAEAIQRLDVEHDLRDAVDAGRLRLHYQPVVNLADGQMVGVEALLRLDHPTRGLLGPPDFLDVAESSGLIIPIGGWVIAEACRQQAAWQASLDRSLQMAVNLSGRQLLQADLCEHVSAIIDGAAMDPARLTLELTETVFTQASRSFLADLEALKARGVRFALDDFGTGFSSLAYLERFPVDVVKIGPTFVAGLGSRTQDTTLVTAIVNLGHTLHLTVVAEGVETPDQLAALQDMGCDLVQGFHFARPSPADQIPGLLAGIRNPAPRTGARR